MTTVFYERKAGRINIGISSALMKQSLAVHRTIDFLWLLNKKLCFFQVTEKTFIVSFIFALILEKQPSSLTHKKAYSFTHKYTKIYKQLKNKKKLTHSLKKHTKMYKQI